MTYEKSPRKRSKSAVVSTGAALYSRVLRHSLTLGHFLEKCAKNSSHYRVLIKRINYSTYNASQLVIRIYLKNEHSLLLTGAWKFREMGIKCLYKVHVNGNITKNFFILVFANQEILLYINQLILSMIISHFPTDIIYFIS